MSDIEKIIKFVDTQDIVSKDDPGWKRSIRPNLIDFLDNAAKLDACFFWPRMPLGSDILL